MIEGLPAVKDIFTINDVETCVIAVDLDELIWTCVNRWGDLKLYRFDENLNYWEIGVDVADWDD